MYTSQKQTNKNCGICNNRIYILQKKKIWMNNVSSSRDYSGTFQKKTMEVVRIMFKKNPPKSYHTWWE